MKKKSHRSMPQSDGPQVDTDVRESIQCCGHLLGLQRPTDDITGYKAGYQRRGRKELCEDIARRYAKAGHFFDRQAVVEDYCAIARELLYVIPVAHWPPPDYEQEWVERVRAARAVWDTSRLSDLIIERWQKAEAADGQPTLERRMRPHFASKPARKAFFKKFDQVIRLWLSLHLAGKGTARVRIADVEPFSMELMHLLARAWLHDAKALRDFLKDAFARWEKLHAPRSKWRVATVTLQIAPLFLVDGEHDIPAIQTHLQRIDALPPQEIGRLHNAQQSGIKTLLSQEGRKPRSKASRIG